MVFLKVNILSFSDHKENIQTYNNKRQKIYNYHKRMTKGGLENELF